MNKTGVVKNPLSVIAIFAGVAEISGTGVLPFISPENQELYIWFLMSFPFTLVVLFFAVLNWNHKVLYAPSDYKEDESFLEGVRSHGADRLEIITLNEKIESDIASAIDSTITEDMTSEEGKNNVARAVKESIRKNTFITVDVSSIT
ncbi:MAG: hypothetical protein OQJ89_00385 [Kangiellaceae bacterium]|nr:hypothetical protein [Kangiellaceae bacterium]